MKAMAVAEAMDFSQSLASLRHLRRDNQDATAYCLMNGCS